jgi:hypothetical protein
VYTTCIFCNGPLGRNESIEHFPVGRRLAFDAAKGRLWVVCPRCERWNLTPLETRWEAIEEAERAYRGMKLRVSTDNIGLARLHEGLDLVSAVSGDAMSMTQPTPTRWHRFPTTAGHTSDAHETALRSQPRYEYTSLPGLSASVAP